MKITLLVKQQTEILASIRNTNANSNVLIPDKFVIGHFSYCTPAITQLQSDCRCAINLQILLQVFDCRCAIGKNAHLQFLLQAEGFSETGVKVGSFSIKQKLRSNGGEWLPGPSSTPLSGDWLTLRL